MTFNDESSIEIEFYERLQAIQAALVQTSDELVELHRLWNEYKIWRNKNVQV